MKYIDLHVHSTSSDGTLSPAELVGLALEKKLAAIALTDHDTVDGLKEAAYAARGTCLELVPGIEFSTEYEGKDIHILGLDIRPEQPGFQKELEGFRSARDDRNKEMARRLREREGFDVSPEQLAEAFGNAVLTRAHFGQYLLQRGYISTIKEAFTRYIGDNCPCFVPRVKLPPQSAISLILETGGIPVLAHPLLYHLEDLELEALVSALKEAGLQGLEAIYSSNTGKDESNMRRLARKFHLKLSGGSDFHGSIKPHIDLGTGKGNLKIPYDLLKKLRSQDS